MKQYYSKNNLWKWILLYVVIGGLIYAGAYYMFSANQSDYIVAPQNHATTIKTTPSAPSPQTTVKQTSPIVVKPQVTGAPVSIRNFAFGPNWVTIHKGETVTWKNDDPMAHSVVADNGLFKSAYLNNGQSYSYTFNTTGTFTYYCSVHPGMKGTVQVIN